MSAEARVERLIASIERDLGILDALVERLELAERTAPWREDDAILVLDFIAALRA